MIQKFLLALAAALGFGSGAAHAATVSAKLIDLDYRRTVNIEVRNTAGNYQIGAYAGRFLWDGQSNASNDPRFSKFFNSFCMDLKDFVAFGQVFTYTLANPEFGPLDNGAGTGINTDLAGGIGTAKTNRLRELYGRYYNDVDTHSEGAAFQLSVWNIIYDADNSVTLNGLTGNKGFRVTQVDGSGSSSTWTTVTSTANSWLTSLTGSGPMKSVASLSSRTKQDQLVVVPLPGAVGAGLALLGARAGSKLLRRQRRL